MTRQKVIEWTMADADSHAEVFLDMPLAGFLAHVITRSLFGRYCAMCLVLWAVRSLVQ